ncbi:hypothetical protein Q3G72_019496 [Acer saccharum]|nr:hypothetical protein Q3G72_019496 [Acer saccharum]
MISYNLLPTKRSAGSVDKLERVIVSVAIDSTQQEALSVLKKIKVCPSPELFMDMLVGDKSIVRRVFGPSKRFQPNKPSTKAQAAVALTSGRMTEAICIEQLRLEAERSSKQAEMEEIRSELLDRGDIIRSWDEKLNEERTRGSEVEKLYASACHDLEQELIVQEKDCAVLLKEKAAMDCQRQLLLNLKEEVDEMSERLESERAILYMHDRGAHYRIHSVIY